MLGASPGRLQISTHQAHSAVQTPLGMQKNMERRCPLASPMSGPCVSHGPSSSPGGLGLPPEQPRQVRQGYQTSDKMPHYPEVTSVFQGLVCNKHCSLWANMAEQLHTLLLLSSEVFLFLCFRLFLPCAPPLAILRFLLSEALMINTQNSS